MGIVKFICIFYLTLGISALLYMQTDHYKRLVRATELKNECVSTCERGKGRL